MKNLLIYTFCAMALLACNGGQKQNNGSQTAVVGDSAEIVSENSETESEIQTNIAEEIFKNNGGQANEVGDTVGFVYEIPEAELRKHINYAKEIFKKVFPSVNCENGGTVIGHKNGGTIIGYTYKIEVTGGGRRIYCYPKNDGGYLVVKEEVDYRRNCKGGYTFAITSYKDGDLYRDDIGALPLPKLEMLLNSDKISGHEFDIAAFKAMYDENPRKYLYYDCQPPDILKVELYPWICFDAVCNMDQCMLWSGHQDQLLEYTWDGTQFVVNSETVPSTNLESISSVGDNSCCDIQEIWRQFAEGKYDAHEPTIEGNTAKYFFMSENEGVHIVNNIKLVCFTNGDSCKVFCVIDDTENDASVSYLNEYNFIGGKLSETELQPELQEYDIMSDAYIENGAIFFTDEDVMFQWNGSTMIKKEILYNE